MEEDDDFGDFGGFEAAEPSTTAVAAPVAASPSPWAVFTPAPVVQNTEDDTPTQTQPESSGLQKSEESVAINAAEVSGVSGNAAIAAVTENTEHVPPTVDELSGSTDKKVTRNAADEWLENLKFPPQNTDNMAPPNENETQSLSTSEEFYKQQIESGREEKLLLEKELQSLRYKQSAIESDLDKCQQELVSQKQKYEDIQKRHTSELEAMRKAGMDALAVIVEEYKELCKVNVMEQREACERQVKEKLEVLTEECQQLLADQHSRLQASLEEDRQKQESVLTEALSKQQELQQSKVQEAIEHEKKSLREVVSNAIEELKESNEKALRSSVDSLRSESKTISSEQKEWLSEIMEERLQVMKSSVQAELEGKLKDAENAMKKVLDADCQKSGDAIKEKAEKTKEEMLDFIKNEKHADVAVRERQLSSLQLFLESARVQVSDLLTDVQSSSSSLSAG